ncbi:hypothetical protein D7V97_15055 [Corallococcus sp. CA053C]|uniref:hypothetical protein n=1 Tax=Corallococcus sp. CA053C TaxID=2316732 RepID=UPI000EA3F0BA|nr:hypothetical protein [Corallococcus sp. CA053C]RKH09964.1 hypothetical protein D7V97_15055 [Corallococcus sp. CA053C]
MSNDFQFDDDDFAKEAGAANGSRVFKEFECPGCDAHNPVDDTFTDGEELRCNYCGCEYLARVNSEGRLKLKAV